MKLEVINTGTEILLGNVTNTHLTFFGQELFPLGLRVERQVCVPDGPAIREALLDTFRCGADVVLVTGGLGPTSDDLTRDITAELLGRPLAVDDSVLAALNAYYEKLSRQMNSRIARQAQVPEGATIIPNDHGTAPGLYLPPGLVRSAESGAGNWETSPHLFLLPGPPRELRPMFTRYVVPMLAKLRPAGEHVPQVEIYRLANIGESNIETMVGAQLAEIADLEVGYCARVGEVDLRLVGSAEALARAGEIVRPAVEPYLFSMKGETLEAVIIARLIEERRTLAVAESCTGGLLAHRLTNVPGGGAAFLAGLTTYAIEAKMKLLGVHPDLIKRCDAVSAEVASEMAVGVRRVTGADYALSTTGYAGPEGGDSDACEPVGTVFIALASSGVTPPIVERHVFLMEREAFKWRATQAALDLLRRKG